MKTPKAIDSERGLLSSLLQNGELMDEYCSLMCEDMFFDNSNRYIYRAIDKLYRDNQPIDLLSVTEKLRELKLINIMGGVSVLSGIYNRVPTSANIAHYYEVVNNAYKRRALIQISDETKSKAYDNEIGVDETIDELQTKLNAQAKEEIKAYDLNSLIINMDDNKTETLKSGYANFDMYYNGFNRKELSIIGGRPSMGKTAFAMSLMLSMANRGYNVIFFSLEMSKESVIDRFVSMESEIIHDKVKRRRIEEHERQFYNECLSKISKLPIKVIDTPRLSIYDIKAKARQYKKRGECDIIFVDYLQIMKMLGKNESTSERIGMSTSRAKDLAKELDIHICMLSQLNRQPNATKSTRPSQRDLRASGEIEQDADMIIFPFRPAVNMPENYEDSYVEVIMAKNRNGGTGMINTEKHGIKWFPEIVKFKEETWNG